MPVQAEEDGVACVEHICGKGGHVDYNTVPGIVYTHPEVASVGKTEEQCKQEGIAVKVCCTSMTVWQCLQQKRAACLLSVKQPSPTCSFQ